MTDFIQDTAACDPDTIRELLAERDALAAEVERLRTSAVRWSLEASKYAKKLDKAREREARQAERLRLATEQAETATDVEPVAWLIHAPEDDYYGIGPVTLQFNPLEQWDLDKGYTQTPLYTRPPENRLLGCATEGCDRPATVRFDRGGVGSEYCHPCYLKVQALAREDGR